MSIGRVISIFIDSSTTECLLFKQYGKLLLRCCVGVFAGRHHEYCKHIHVIIWERGCGGAYPSSPRARSKGTPYLRIPDRTKS